MTAPAPLAGRVAVVTGATRNIGLAVACRLAAAGADVLISARSVDGLRRAQDVVSGVAAGGRVAAVPADVTSADQMTALGAHARQRFGGVDVVVNNALVVAKHPVQSTAAGRSLLDAPVALWEEGFAGYVHGPLALVREVRPDLARRGGSVINLVSTANFRIVDGFGVYGVVKAAMWEWTRYLAAELAPRVRVNAVCPGTVSETGELVEEDQRPLLAKVPLGRMGRAAEVAESVLFLASDASS